jgi:hypothetical protein
MLTVLFLHLFPKIKQKHLTGFGNLSDVNNYFSLTQINKSTNKLNFSPDGRENPELFSEDLE